MPTYVLSIHYLETCRIKVGAIGWIEVVAGPYVYVGSAKRSWQTRVGRHLSQEKKMRWHIDYLLAAPKASIVEVWLTEKNIECPTAMALSQEAYATLLVRGIGSSDCRCPSHFLALGDSSHLAKKCLRKQGYTHISRKGSATTLQFAGV